MGFLSQLGKTVLDVATSPVDIVKDIVTMGGALIDEKPATLKKLTRFCGQVKNAISKEEIMKAYIAMLTLFLIIVCSPLCGNCEDKSTIDFDDMGGDFGGGGIIIY